MITPKEWNFTLKRVKIINSSLKNLSPISTFSRVKFYSFTQKGVIFTLERMKISLLEGNFHFRKSWIEDSMFLSGSEESLIHSNWSEMSLFWSYVSNSFLGEISLFWSIIVLFTLLHVKSTQIWFVRSGGVPLEPWNPCLILVIFLEI